MEQMAAVKLRAGIEYKLERNAQERGREPPHDS